VYFCWDAISCRVWEGHYFGSTDMLLASKLVDGEFACGDGGGRVERQGEERAREEVDKHWSGQFHEVYTRLDENHFARHR